MASLSPAELLDWLERYQFLSQEQVEPLRNGLSNFPDSHTLAKELIRRDWLTPFQINQILQGKHDQLVLDSYRLRERIGEGAMGQVFKAWQPKFDRIVALKVILRELVNSPKALERFRREAEAAAKLEHPNIARVFDAGECDGRPYLVMEFVDGFNLSLRVKQQGPLPIHEAVEYTRQAALGLQHAYERGIVHRDIKPGNLLVANATDAAGPLVKILDFGLARFESEEDSTNRLTEMGKILGTIDYIAPEQAHDAHGADIRADIYSLGCTLFYLLTGRPAFLGENVVERLGPRMTGEAPWVRADRPEIAPVLEDVLRTMMARKPEDRYQTPKEVADALSNFVVPIAMAMPVAAAPVALALPVAPGEVAANVPMAQPIAASGSSGRDDEVSFEHDHSFDGMTATGLDLSHNVAAQMRTQPQARSSFPTKLVAILGGGIALVTLLSCVCILALFFRPAPEENGKKTGVIRIDKARWSMHDGVATEGQRHTVSVWLTRVDCKGPINVTLIDLPPGVTCDGRMFPPGATQDDVRFTVSYGTEPFANHKLKVFAECETDGAKAEFPMTLSVKANPHLKK